jgi:hypothetical protein
MAESIALAGYISRANLPTPLANLPILVDPYNMILGDQSEAADASMKPGIEPTQSVTKYITASSPYVPGSQVVLATPDNATLNLRLIIDGGGSFAGLEAQVAPIIQAIRGQLSFQVSVSFDAWVSTWACYSGDYLVAMNQLWMFGYLCPMYLTLPRDPIPIAGPI